MKIHLLERTELFPCTINTVFNFLTDARNEERLAAPFVHFEFLREPPATIIEGTLLEYRLRLYGVPFKWRTKIEILEPPLKLVDIQDRGPFALFRHTHEFRALGDQTEMTDRVEYAIPFGPIGEIARLLFVDRSLREIFDYRQRELVAAMKT